MTCSTWRLPKRWASFSDKPVYFGRWRESDRVARAVEANAPPGIALSHQRGGSLGASRSAGRTTPREKRLPDDESPRRSHVADRHLDQARLVARQVAVEFAAQGFRGADP